MKTVSLFSGCGGSDLGAKQAGADVVFALDISKNAMKTYEVHKELIASAATETKVGDVRRLSALPECDLLLGCYPCQSFSMGGRRSPDNDDKASLYLAFAKGLSMSNARYAVVENVAGLAWLDGGAYLQSHLEAIANAGSGYSVTYRVIDAQDYGVPARRRRLFLVAVRNDEGVHYHFPPPSHGPASSDNTPYSSHGDAIAHLPEDPAGEYYVNEKEQFSWWYMSRNRKRKWEEPSYTILGNWRHTPLHPASPAMKMVSSNLSDGWKQTWVFTEDYDHLDVSGRPILAVPRRLSWREAAAIQTFPPEFEPCGSVAAKFSQIGNAVPPLMMRSIVTGIVNGQSLLSTVPQGTAGQLWARSQSV